MAKTSDDLSIDIRVPKEGGLFKRFFTKPDQDPMDEVEWEIRDARIGTGDKIAFEQTDVEFPVAWSQNATNIVAQKYFRGPMGTPQRERSVRQMIGRVVNWYTEKGSDDRYFDSKEDQATFKNELTHLLVNQKMAFNSPVWFNVGLVERPRASACFILDVEDEMSSILNWYVEEGLIFKAGSGAGINLSKLRSSKEQLTTGGTASGPVSFMRGADASAGTIKSGGSTRRAAKMVVLDVEHPDIEEFIDCKVQEERKARALREAGFDMDLDGKDSHSIQYQNANNSVGLSDEFLQTYVDDKDWDLKAVKDGRVLETVKARALMRKIAEAAWECADPGVFYMGTMNSWHTSPAEGPIRATNPCFTGDTRVHTDKGLIRFDDLVVRAAKGETFGIYTHDATNKEAPAEKVEVTNPIRYMVTGMNEVLNLKFSNGMQVRATPNHKFFTTNRGMVPASELTADDKVKVVNVPTPATLADWSLPAEAMVAASRKKSEQHQQMNLPEKWSTELADYLGWLIGDGCFSVGGFSTIYGGQEDQEHVLPRHQKFLTEINGGRVPKVAVQANGTQQLRVTRHALIRFIEALGMKRVTAPDKDIPTAIFEAPPEVQAAFLRSLFDADGCVVLGQVEKGTRYVGLYSRSEDLLQNVQRLLSAFGVRSRIYTEKRRARKGSFTYTRKDGTYVEYESDTGFDLRISGSSIRDFHSRIGFTLPSKAAKLQEAVSHEFYSVDESTRIVSKESDGFELTYNLTESRNHSYTVSGLVAANCGEFVRPANTSCNLASLRLTKFVDAAGEFQVDAFVSAVETTLTAMDISVTNAEYPTEKISNMVSQYRELGLGYTDLGAVLMDEGVAYDSEEGRAWAASITALMSGIAYRRSAELAAAIGPYSGWSKEGNAKAHLDVIRRHREAVDEIDDDRAPANVLTAARDAWDDALELGAKHGYRNAQTTLLAPTGTISFLMDADTTGIEPDLALVKTKKLVGGGTMKIVNQKVPSALKRLGYEPHEISEILSYISEHNSVKGAPFMKEEHHSVFDCAMGDSPIHYLGHMKMMAAVQPYLCGSISKTINLPEDATVDDIESLYVQGWKMGLKNLAMYRDNCKVGQPLNADKKKVDPASEGPPTKTVRRRLPRKRNAKTMSFKIADCDGYVTAGEYPDTEELGEIFLKVAKQGSTLAGIMDAFAISVSVGLQSGVPLKTYVDKFINMRFEPSGVTDDPDFRFATSIVDYIFRRLASDYLTDEEKEAVNVKTTGERQASLDGGVPIKPNGHSNLESDSSLIVRSSSDAPLCYTCGIKMQPAGSCFVCNSCGTTSGCS